MLHHPSGPVHLSIVANPMHAQYASFTALFHAMATESPAVLLAAGAQRRLTKKFKTLSASCVLRPAECDQISVARHLRAPHVYNGSWLNPGDRWSPTGNCGYGSAAILLASRTTISSPGPPGRRFRERPPKDADTLCQTRLCRMRHFDLA